jgi:hypothetical protein
VFRALNYLINRQERNGDLGGKMYAHGLAAIALCEAYALSGDPRLRQPAQRALDFICWAQHPTTGGWRYTPRQEGDTSVVAWQVMALQSGRMAGLNVPPQALELSRRWLDSCQVADSQVHGYSYQPKGRRTPPMTAAGLLNRQYLGWGPRNPDLHRGCDYLLDHLPPSKPAAPIAKEVLGTIYYYYYATQVLHHMEGKYWETWNPLMRDFLVRTQHGKDSGHKFGSWSPEGADYGSRGGRLYTTSLALLTLEVYYRHLPLYRRDLIAKNMAAAPEAKPEPEKKDNGDNKK